MIKKLVDIHIYNHQNDLKISEDNVKAVVDEVIRVEGKKCDEVSIHFVDTSKIIELHAKYFDDPTPTDCISFPIDEPNSLDYCVLGEVFVCPKTAIDYSAKQADCPYKEMTLYIVHGLLHLLGYDDIGKTVQLMRQAEERHMQNLEVRKLILT